VEIYLKNKNEKLCILFYFLICHYLFVEFLKMTTNYNPITLQRTYDSFLDFVSADKNRIHLCKDILNVWKASDEPFLKMITLYFETENALALFPTFKLYSDLVDQFQKKQESQLLHWVKDFNRVFLMRIKNEMNPTPLCASNDGNNTYIEEAFQKCTHILQGLQLKNQELQLKNQELETEVQRLNNELSEEKMKVGYLISSVGHAFDEEATTFRKRVRAKISKLSNNP
jgi:hypothetical protein